MDETFELLRDAGDLVGIVALIYLAVREYFHLTARRDELKAKQKGSAEFRAMSSLLEKLTDHIVEQNKILAGTAPRDNE